MTSADLRRRPGAPEGQLRQCPLHRGEGGNVQQLREPDRRHALADGAPGLSTGGVAWRFSLSGAPDHLVRHKKMHSMTMNVLVGEQMRRLAISLILTLIAARIFAEDASTD